MLATRENGGDGNRSNDPAHSVRAKGAGIVHEASHISRCYELSALDRQRSGRGLAASRGGRPTSRQTATDRGGGRLTPPARSSRELSGELLRAAAPTSQAAGTSLRSSVSPHRHRQPSQGRSHGDAKTLSGNGRERTKLACRLTVGGSGTGHFSGRRGKQTRPTARHGQQATIPRWAEPLVVAILISPYAGFSVEIVSASTQYRSASGHIGRCWAKDQIAGV
jgi:hypothetical protein